MNDVIERNFSHHVPSEVGIVNILKIREKAKEFACLINEVCPEGRERSLAMTKLEEVMFWANASIARND